MIQFLADHVGKQDFSPAHGIRMIAMDRDQMAALHLVCAEFSRQRKVETTLPMAPVMPGAKMIIDFRTAEDGVFRAAAMNDIRWPDSNWCTSFSYVSGASLLTSKPPGNNRLVMSSMATLR
ncbi:MAG: hypothetical protein WAU16_01470 [Rhizobiaceae bacterium]